VKFTQIYGFDNVKKVVRPLSLYYFALKDDGSVWYRRNVSDAQTYLLPCIKDVIDINISSDYIVFLFQDGTVYKWNKYNVNSYFMGNNESEIPVQINGLSDIVCIGPSQSGMCFVRKDGLAFSMGSLSSGKLGNGLLNQNYPKKTEREYVFNDEDENLEMKKKVSNSFCGEYELLDDGTVIPVSNVSKQNFSVKNLSNVVRLYANYDYILALKDDGTVWAWGKNQYGQLGDGTNITRYEPVQVKNLSGIVDIIVGKDQNQGDYAIARRHDGTLWAWGRNNNGYLGDGTTEDRYIPVKLVDENKSELNGIISVKLGRNYILALKDDGTVWAWGKNEYGQLGDGTNTQSLLPKKVNNLSGVITISTGDYHSLALKDDGSIWSWGNNSEGQLGNNGVTNSNIPVKVVGLSNVVAIEAEASTSIFMDNNYTLWECGAIKYDTLARVTMENDANLRYITINNSFLESFDEDLTEYNVILPPGTTKAPNVELKTYNPYATYTIVQPDTIDGIAIIEVTACDGETTKTYKIKFNPSSYAD